MLCPSGYLFQYPGVNRMNTEHRFRFPVFANLPTYCLLPESRNDTMERWACCKECCPFQENTRGVEGPYPGRRTRGVSVVQMRVCKRALAAAFDPFPHIFAYGIDSVESISSGEQEPRLSFTQHKNSVSCMLKSHCFFHGAGWFDLFIRPSGESPETLS